MEFEGFAGGNVDEMVVIAADDHDLGQELEGFAGANADEMVVIAADDNVDLGQLQQLIQSGNVLLATDDQDLVQGEAGEDSQVIHLTAEQTALLNSGVPLEQILSSIPGIGGAFGGDYSVAGFQTTGVLSSGIGVVGAGNPNGVTYRCPSCPTMYVNANAFTKHMREKHFVRVYTCRNCPEFYDSLSNLFLHARRAHVDPKKPKKNPALYKFHCETCGYMTNNGGTMEHHKRAHTGEKPYSCDVCGKRFAQKANMKTHRNRHTHTERLFKCDTCNKGFASHDIYLAHLRTREHELREHYTLISSSSLQLECLGCRIIFDNVYSLNKHYRCCRVVRSLQMKFRCILCDVLLADLISLKSHVKQHEGVTSIGCPVCGERGFPGFNQLNHHITRAHALKVNRRHVCRYCESTYESKRDLEQHVKQMHSDERNARQSRGAVGRLKCSYNNCDFTTNSIMLLDRHHMQHRQLEEEGLDANQPNLPPARNETRGPRKTMPKPLGFGSLSGRGRGRKRSHMGMLGERGLRGDMGDSEMFEEEVVAMMNSGGHAGSGAEDDDDDAQSDWEAEFQAALAREQAMKREGIDVSDMNLFGSDFNEGFENGHYKESRHRSYGDESRSHASRTPYATGAESSRSGRIRRLPARFQDYDTEVGVKNEDDDAVFLRRVSQTKRESATFRSSYGGSTSQASNPALYRPAYADMQDLVNHGCQLLQPQVILEWSLRSVAEDMLASGSADMESLFV